MIYKFEPRDLEIIHYYQKSFKTCGPTSLRMIMSSYWFFESEEFFTDLCRTGRIWTDSDYMADAVSFLWGTWITHINWNLKMIKNYLKKWYKILIWYWYWFWIVWHYAVCTDISSTHITLQDPSHWPDHKYTKYYFENSMWNLWSHKNWKRWFLAIKF